MAEPSTLEELTKLVRERMSALGLGDVGFSIRPLPFEPLNWDIHFQTPMQLRKEAKNALITVGRDLRAKHYLLLNNVPSPYAA